MKTYTLNYLITFCLALLLSTAVIHTPLSSAAFADQPNEKPSSSLAERPEQFELVETGVVEKILKPDIIILANNSRYRLDNLRMPAARNAYVSAALNNLLLHRKVNIYAYPSEWDSSKNNELNDMPVAHVVRADGIWVQQYLVEKGFAWAFSSPSSRKLVKVLYKFEEAARARQLGLWGDSRFSLRSYKAVGAYINSFQVVQGKIAFADNSANEVYGYSYKPAYFHFGDNFKEDFSFRIMPENLGLFQTRNNMNINSLTWVGRRIRIRGWVEEDGGPMIELTHPEQIEFLDDAQ